MKIYKESITQEKIRAAKKKVSELLNIIAKKPTSL